MLPKIYTSQYRYSGEDRLDITVKGQDPIGRIFAPTWEMVKGIKENKLTEQDYTNKYIEVLNQQVSANYTAWDKFMTELSTRGRVTLVCFCPAGAFCHRTILAASLAKARVGYYEGELPTSGVSL